MNKKFQYSVLIALFILSISGCRTLKVDEQASDTGYKENPAPEPERVGVYHKVNRGETLWRIAKTYNIDVDALVSGNKISNATKLEENQLVFIPGATEVKRVHLEPMDKSNEFAWPVSGKVIHYFRQRVGAETNYGIDISVPAGQVVNASRSGKVVMSDYLPGFGNTVVIDHEDGYYSMYGHNAKLLVSVGDLVNKHDPVAHVGSQNNESYLHFQIRRHSTDENPLFYLP